MASMTISEGTLDWRWAVKEEAIVSRERRHAEGNSLSWERGENHHST
jgi:hypothetical protein